MGGTPTDGSERLMSKKWYVVHAYSGFEKTVQRTLLDRIARAGMQDKLSLIHISEPTRPY